MKVFSIKKYVEDLVDNKRIGEIISLINSNNTWQKKCEGKTEQEMKEMGYNTFPDWMEEK